MGDSPEALISVINNTPTSYHVEIKTDNSMSTNDIYCKERQIVCPHASNNGPQFYNNKPYVQGKEDDSNVKFGDCCSSFVVTLWPYAEWAPGKWGNIIVNSCTKHLSHYALPYITLNYGPEKCGSNVYCCSWNQF